MSKDTQGLQKVDNATFKYAVSGPENSQPLTANKKLDVGTYTLYAYVNGETKPVAETEFTVVQRAVTLRVVTPKDGVDQTLVNPSTQLSLTADTKNMTADEIAALHLGYTLSLIHILLRVLGHGLRQGEQRTRTCGVVVCIHCGGHRACRCV